MGILHLAADQQTWAPELFALLRRVSLGEPIEQDGAAFVPLILDDLAGAPGSASAAEPATDAELLEEALQAGHTQVDEVSAHGHVPELRVEHGGKRPLLLLDGEQVVGGKQNRIFNASFVVLPGASVVVPVSCVEQGRWGRSGRFQASEGTLYATARSKKLRTVTREAQTTGRYRTNQGEVWADVSDFLESTQTMSATDAFEEGTRVRAREKRASLERLKPLPRQVGLALVRGEKLVSLDLFGSPELYARAWKKVGQGLVIDEETAGAATSDPRDTVTRTLQRLVDGTGKRLRPSEGCGETLHGGTPDVNVGAALDGGALYHALIAAS